jgi:hypothetical protein
MWHSDTIGSPQRNRMKKIALYKKLEACKKMKRSLLTSYMAGYHQSMLLDAQIISLTREIDELSEPKKKL